MNSDPGGWQPVYITITGICKWSTGPYASFFSLPLSLSECPPCSSRDWTRVPPWKVRRARGKRGQVGGTDCFGDERDNKYALSGRSNRSTTIHVPLDTQTFSHIQLFCNFELSTAESACISRMVLTCRGRWRSSSRLTELKSGLGLTLDRRAVCRLLVSSLYQVFIIFHNQ